MAAVSFANRAVIVTGAGGALGRTYALDIARRGGAVVANDLGCDARGEGRSPELADKVVAEITAAGGRAVASYDDVADPAGAARTFALALKTFGRLDALINNAGTLRCAWVQDLKDEDRDSMLRMHLISSFNMTRAVWEHMKKQRYGRVVFTSSGAGMLGNATQGAYGAAKAGVTGLMNVMAQEGEPHGILCNAIMPNADSRLAAGMDMSTMTEIVPYATAIYPQMDPAFTAPMVVYLASEACTTTHAIYSSLGGRMARVFIGVTQGWQGSKDRPSTADEVAAHIDDIRDLKRGINIPKSLIDEFRMVATDAEPQVK